MRSILSTTSIIAALVAGPIFAQTTIVTETTPSVTEIQTDTGTTGGGAAGGAASGAIARAAVGGPVGAAVGAVAGGVVGDISEDALTPETRTYVMENKTESVVIDGDLAVGTQVPETVEIHTIPETEYSYVYVDERAVLIEPQSRKVVHIYDWQGPQAGRLSGWPAEARRWGALIHARKLTFSPMWHVHFDTYPKCDGANRQKAWWTASAWRGRWGITIL